MSDPPKRTLGRTGLQVSTLDFGALELRGTGRRRPAADARQPKRILHAVLDTGINYIDVTVDYGKAKAHIGRCISHRRQEFFLAARCGCPLDVSTLASHKRTR